MKGPRSRVSRKGLKAQVKGPSWRFLYPASHVYLPGPESWVPGPTFPVCLPTILFENVSFSKVKEIIVGSVLLLLIEFLEGKFILYKLSLLMYTTKAIFSCILFQ